MDLEELEFEENEQNSEMGEQHDGETDDTSTLAVLIEMRQEMRREMGTIVDRLQRLETTDKPPRQSEGAAAITDVAVPESNATDTEQATPDSLRQDLRLMRQAAVRLANLQADDSDEDDYGELTRRRNTGKKSGAALTAVDTVEHRIDWPHFHVKRMPVGNKKGVHFNELKVEEFVYGFLTMLEAPKAKWNFRDMITMLKHLMQDAMEFTWPNALTFYQKLGSEIEGGQTKWDDKERIRDLRMTYARTVFPAKRETRDSPTKPQLQSAPAGMKCCVPFQKHTCDNDRDHAPFTHACAYCFKARSALCRHAEDDCMRKTTDIAKNGRAREQ